MRLAERHCAQPHTNAPSPPFLAVSPPPASPSARAARHPLLRRGRAMKGKGLLLVPPAPAAAGPREKALFLEERRKALCVFRSSEDA